MVVSRTLPLSLSLLLSFLVYPLRYTHTIALIREIVVSNQRFAKQNQACKYVRSWTRSNPSLDRIRTRSTGYHIGLNNRAQRVSEADI